MRFISRIPNSVTILRISLSSTVQKHGLSNRCFGTLISVVKKNWVVLNFVAVPESDIRRNLSSLEEHLGFQGKTAEGLQRAEMTELCLMNHHQTA